MTFLRSVYAVPEERCLYRVLSTVREDADGNSEWLYFHAASGFEGSALLDAIIDRYGEVIDIASAQVFDEVEDSWCDLQWDMSMYDSCSEFSDEDDTSMLF